MGFRGPADEDFESISLIRPNSGEGNHRTPAQPVRLAG
jgi:hypothetical protein